MIFGSPGQPGAEPSRVLRQLLGRGSLAMAPGAADALSARLIEQAGFPLCYFTAAGFSNSQFAFPDVGLVTLSEVADQIRRITEAIAVPLIADGDTGHGNALNVMRTVREFERAGAAGIQLEDQVTPKRCGHFDGKLIVPIEEMRGKLRAAAEARRSDDFVVIARTDARAVDGFGAAIDRAAAYAEAGADVLFIEAPQSIDELERIPRLLPARPHIVNVTPSGKTPLLSATRLEQLGYRIAIFPNLALQVAMKAVRDALDQLRATGDLESLAPQLISWKERQELVRLPEVEAMERRLVETQGGNVVTNANNTATRIGPRTP